ncbi:FG-GAP repeat protein [Planobispora rosea]|uniref:FG-GAP repeat protein n=1 Tax=Planobispora rosea TaxID=35762 RepID=UPI00083A42A8|nr:FG-GAP repeat protein [Planobispora rosea]
MIPTRRRRGPRLWLAATIAAGLVLAGIFLLRAPAVPQPVSGRPTALPAAATPAPLHRITADSSTAGCDWRNTPAGDAHSIWLLGVRRSRIATPAQPVSLLMADLDHDRCSDVVTGLTDGTVMIIWGEKHGSTPTRILRPPSGRGGSAFGRSLTAYRNILAVGAPYDGDPGAPASGAVYVYAFTGRTPGESQRISQNSPGVVGSSEPGDHFGWSLAAGRFPERPGIALAVGAPDENTDGAGAGNGPGVKSAGAMTLLIDPLTDARRSRKYTYAQGAVPGARYGYALAAGNLDEESHLLVGAPDVDAVDVITTHGHRPLEVSDTLLSPQPGVHFGTAVAMADGRAVVGMPQAGDGRGAVSVGLVSPRARPATVLTAPDGHPGDRFGATVTITDSLKLVVGAPGHAGVGAVTLYDLDTLETLDRLAPASGASGFGGVLSDHAPAW